ncbi:MAG: molybdopterin-dependent oxidoreductase, partial [Candidatus Krumholzibacteria bacterium]|nr:molybdopterin-dependent oxidoreductase [Candidatus Krumholzibacteria bacterium]
MNRRDFVRLMGLASGASLINSCGLERQSEKIIPYLVPPDEGVIPGKAVYTRTTCAECPAGCGVSAKTVDYRAGKLEGVDGHPIGGGALCMRGQSSLARLYHPDRLTRPMRKDEQGKFAAITWDDAYQSIVAGMGSGRDNVFLSGRTTGTLSGLIDEFCRDAGVERLPEFEMLSHAAIREANRLVFGRREVPSYRIEDADFLLTLGADIFETFVSPVSHAVQFGRAKKKAKFDWYHAEPHASLTGLQAKRRYVVTPGSETYLLTFLLRKVSRANLAGDRHIAGIVESLPNLSARGYAEKTGLDASDLNHIADHMLSARRPLVITGGVSTMHSHGLDAAVLTALLQWSTGMIGSTVDFARAEDHANVGTPADVSDLSRRLRSGGVGVVFLSRLNLMANAGSSAMVDDLSKAELSVGFGQFLDDTVAMCDLVLPLSDTLESWGDSAARRGTISVIQPVVEPLYDTRTEGDILLALAGRRMGQESTLTYQEYLFGSWSQRFGEGDVEKLLADGYLDLRTGPQNASLNRSDVERYVRAIKLADSPVQPILVAAPSMRFYDGRSRDIALVSEVPDPLTTVSWGAWLSISKATAREISVKEKAEVRLEAAGWSSELPVKIQPGLARGVMSIDFTTPGLPPFATDDKSGELITTLAGVSIRETGKMIAIPILSGSQSQEGRGVIPKPVHDNGHHHHDSEATLYPENKYPDYRWGMAIDLDLCIGCSACAAACYVENNVPVVGREDHLRGREMSWLRIEPFFEEDG